MSVVEGTVCDPSGRAVRGARVVCAGRETASGMDGKFRFEGLSECRAEVGAAGFDTQSVELRAGAAARIDLVIAGVTDRVVVSATRTVTTADEAGVAATVVTRSEIERREFPMFHELLRTVPSLGVVQTGRQGGLTAMFTRGAQRTGTLLLLDGMPLNDPGGEVNLGQLQSAAIERIEVVRGAESALFGSEAAAGVVQMFTRRGDAEQRVPHGWLSVERGNFSTDRWTANLAGGSGARLDYSLTAERLRTSGEFPNDGFRSVAGTGSVGYRLSSNSELFGVFRGHDSSMGVPGQVAYGLTDPNARETMRDNALSLRLENQRGRYLERISFGYHRNRDIYYDPLTDGPFDVALLVRDLPGPVRRVERLAILNPKALPATLPAGERIIQQNWLLWPLDEPYLSDTSRKRFGYQGSLAHRGGTAVFGCDYERQEGEVSKHDAGRHRNGLFLHEQYAVGGRVFLAGGLRWEHSTVFGNKLAPRGAVSVLVAGERGAHSSTLLRVSAGRGITEPSLIQNFSRESYFTGNPDLRPEKTSSYEAGLVEEWFGRRLRTEVAAFHNSFRDLISFVSVPPPVFGTWRNIDSSRARGVEFSTRARLNSVASVSASYTRLWTRIIHSNSPASLFTGIGQELSKRPPHSGAIALSLAPRKWSFEAGAVLVSERQDTDFFGINRNSAYQNVYGALTLNFWPHVKPFVRADNALNARYEEVLGYSALSRAVRAGVRMEW
ncbi:MAG: TonB-dependent receptor [Acidobacteria bacterium]|nr:TonB-dependent receptor [Acidobacteriota bacterium]